LLASARRFPESRSASLASITPLSGTRWNGDVAVEGYIRKPDEKPYIDFNAVSPSYFESMGIPMLLGRDFRVEDNPSFTPDPNPNPGPGDDKKPLDPPQPVAIINETMARKFFPEGNPIGRHFSQSETFDMSKAFEIIGVVKDSRYFNLREPVESMIYVPIWRFGWGRTPLLIKTSGTPASLVGAVRREVQGIDPAIPVLETRTMEEQFDNTISQERVVTTLSGFFGILAVLLATIGLYGVMAHAVTRRYREIGIRIALGSSR